MRSCRIRFMYSLTPAQSGKPGILAWQKSTNAWFAAITTGVVGHSVSSRSNVMTSIDDVLGVEEARADVELPRAPAADHFVPQPGDPHEPPLHLRCAMTAGAKETTEHAIVSCVDLDDAKQVLSGAVSYPKSRIAISFLISHPYHASRYDHRAVPYGGASRRRHTRARHRARQDHRCARCFQHIQRDCVVSTRWTFRKFCDVQKHVRIEARYCTYWRSIPCPLPRYERRLPRDALGPC